MALCSCMLVLYYLFYVIYLAMFFFLVANRPEIFENMKNKFMCCWRKVENTCINQKWYKLVLPKYNRKKNTIFQEEKPWELKKSDLCRLDFVLALSLESLRKTYLISFISVADPNNFAPDLVFKILDPDPEPAWIWPNIENFQDIFFYSYWNSSKIFYSNFIFCHITRFLTKKNFS